MYNSVYYLFCSLLYAIDSIIFNKVLHTIFPSLSLYFKKGPGWVNVLNTWITK